MLIRTLQKANRAKQIAISNKTFFWGAFFPNAKEKSIR